VTRLAEAHNTSVYSLMKNGTYPIVGKVVRLIERGSKARALNGICEDAEKISKALEVLTSVEKIKHLSFFQLKAVLTNQSLIKVCKAWCPLCLDVWRKEKRTIYEPLIWAVKVVNICLIHSIYLENKCRNCSTHIYFLERTIRIGFCPKCNTWLGRQSEKDINKCSETDFDWQKWVISNIGELLEFTPKLNIRNLNDVSQIFIQLEEQLHNNNKSILSFAKEINLPTFSNLTEFKNNKKPN
jgi:hypothetical protein